MSSPLSAGGVLLDVAGAVFLAMGFMVKRPESVRREAATYLGMNPFLQLSLLTQKADAQLGMCFLVAGFSCQFAGSTGWSPGWARFEMILPLAGLVAVGGALLLPRLRRHYTVPAAVVMIDERLKTMSKRDRVPTEREWEEAVGVLGEYLGVTRRAGEPLGVYGRRLVGSMWWSLERHLPGGLRTS